MNAIISVVISVLVKVLPVLLDWIVKKAAEPDKKLRDDQPAPETLRKWMSDQIVKHEGYQKRLEKNEKKP